MKILSLLVAVAVALSVSGCDRDEAVYAQPDPMARLAEDPAVRRLRVEFKDQRGETMRVTVERGEPSLFRRIID